MRLDQVGLGRATGFDGVGINRALAQDPVPVEKLLRFENALLHAHKLLADDVPLFFWINSAGECA
jgi:hypothetical protein